MQERAGLVIGDFAEHFLRHITRHPQHGGVRPLFGQAVGQRHSVGARQDQVGNHEIDSAGIVPGNLECFLGSLRLKHVVAAGPEDQGDEPLDANLIVDDQDRFPSRRHGLRRGIDNPGGHRLESRGEKEIEARAAARLAL